jgi:hypothetical protein
MHDLSTWFRQRCFILTIAEAFVLQWLYFRNDDLDRMAVNCRNVVPVCILFQVRT